MRVAAVLLLAGCCGMQAHAQYGERRVQYGCDDKRSELRLGFEDAEVPSPASQRPADQYELRFPGPRGTGRASPGGSELRSPAIPRVVKCGKLELRLWETFLNENPDGELGVVFFQAFELFIGRKRVLGPLGFATCDVGLSRWSYFGACPSDYVDAVYVRMLSETKPRVRVIVKRSYNSEHFETKVSTDEFVAP